MQPPLSPQKPRSPGSPHSPSRRQGSTQIFAEVTMKATCSLLFNRRPALFCLIALVNTIGTTLCFTAQNLAHSVPRYTVALEVPYRHSLSQAKVDTVPQFYFPGGKAVPAEVREQALAKIDDLFRSSPDGLAVPAVRELVKEVYHNVHPAALSPPSDHSLHIASWRSQTHLHISAQLHCRGV